MIEAYFLGVSLLLGQITVAVIFGALWIAYLAWRDTQQAKTTEEETRRVLANVATIQSRRQEPDRHGYWWK